MTARPDHGDRRDAALPDRVRELATPVAEEHGVELLDVEVKGQPGRRIVRLIADAIDPTAGLDVDRIADVSRAVGRVLEETDLVPGAYTLEVTSPGVTRPLRTTRDFLRNVGREVRVTRQADLGDPRELTGEVLTADEDAVTLRVGGQERRVPLAEVDHGKVVLPW